MTLFLPESILADTIHADPILADTIHADPILADNILAEPILALPDRKNTTTGHTSSAHL